MTIPAFSSESIPTREAYAAIEYLYHYFNQALFAGTLPTCLFTFQRQPRVMGYFSQRRWVDDQRCYVDELAINPEYLYGCPVEELCQTVVHEMCHLWQFHFGTPSRRSYHNRQWAEKMVSLGLIPSTTGEPGGAMVGQRMDDYLQDSGPLHKAIQELVRDGFRLKWIDTAPAITKPRKPKIYTVEGIKIESSTRVIGSVRAVSELPAKPIELMEAEAGILETVWEPSFEEPLLIEFESPLQLVDLPDTVKKPQTRVKYRCSCAKPNQVWGRPHLNIQCLDCNQNFIVCV